MTRPRPINRCHPERSEGSAVAFVILFDCRIFAPDGERSDEKAQRQRHQDDHDQQEARFSFLCGAAARSVLRQSFPLVEDFYGWITDQT